MNNYFDFDTILQADLLQTYYVNGKYKYLLRTFVADESKDTKQIENCSIRPPSVGALPSQFITEMKQYIDKLADLRMIKDDQLMRKEFQNSLEDEQSILIVLLKRQFDMLQDEYALKKYSANLVDTIDSYSSCLSVRSFVKRHPSENPKEPPRDIPYWQENPIENIVGPITFYKTYWQDKRIYLFGDHHEILAGCQGQTNFQNSIYIHELILRILRNNPNKIIDFFVEAPLLKAVNFFERMENYKKQKKDYIGNVIETFAVCNDIDKKNCLEKFPNLRYHYSDIRQMSPSESNVFAWAVTTSRIFAKLPLVMHTSNGNVVDIQATMNQPFYRLWKLNVLAQMQKSDFLLESFNLQYWFKTMIFSTFIHKQIFNIQGNDSIKNSLKTSINTIVNEVVLKSFPTNWINSLKQIALVEHLTDTDLIHAATTQRKYAHERESWLNYFIQLMDLYLIGRVFRTFDKDKMIEYTAKVRKLLGPNVHVPATPENIIIYAGNDHIRNYLKFFHDHQIETLIISRNKQQCLKLIKSYENLDLFS